MAVVVAGEDYKFRIAFNGVERQAQLDIGDGLLPVRARDLPSGQREILLKQEKNKAKALRNSQHAAMIDVDMYQDDPVEFDTRHFIVNGFEMITSKLQAAVQVQK